MFATLFSNLYSSFSVNKDIKYRHTFCLLEQKEHLVLKVFDFAEKFCFAHLPLTLPYSNRGDAIS